MNSLKIPSYINYTLDHSAQFDPVIYLDISDKQRKNNHLLYDNIRQEIRHGFGKIPFFQNKEISICYQDINQCANFSIKLPYLYYFYLLLLLFSLLALFSIPLYFIYRQQLITPFMRMQRLANELDIPFTTNILQPLNFKNLAQLMHDTCHKIEALNNEKIYTIKAISHDLKTPLTKAELYMYNNIPQEYHAELLKYYDDMKYLLAQIAVYARKNYRHETSHNMDLVDLTESVCYEYLSNGFAVRFSSMISSVRINMPHRALKRVLQNIIDNALKYAGSVSVHLKLCEEKAILSFTDTGPGIQEASISKLGQPFYRVDAARNQNVPGCGLGLAISMEILAQSKNELKIYNNHMSKGLTVEIVFSHLIL